MCNQKTQKSQSGTKNSLIKRTTSAGNCGSLSFPLKTPVLVRTDDHGWPACKGQIMQGKHLFTGNNGQMAHYCF